MSIHINFNGFDRFLSQEFKAKLPRATASALNTAAKEIRTALVQHESTDLHTTTKWLQRNTQYEAARSAQGNNMQAEVGITDAIKYAELLVSGGTRTPDNGSKVISIPVDAPKRKTLRTNAKSALLKKNTFIANIDGKAGVWQKDKADNLKLLYLFEDQTNYTHAPYLDFDKIVIDTCTKIDLETLIENSILKQLGIK